MTELTNIIHDIPSGAMPLSALPGFLRWLLFKFFWVLIIFAVGGTTVAMIISK